VWCFAFAGVGWAVGSSYKSFDKGFRYVEIVVVAGVLVLAAYLVLRRRRVSRLSHRGSDPTR
jgi:membrane protein DedA with SNARE-associated domain